ncbi:MAG TPA: DUF6776 family protein [Gammaproteobacteria bacterium]|nr:DUF6776 family protein [Gammaproteobacteria bacterium]
MNIKSRLIVQRRPSFVKQGVVAVLGGMLIILLSWMVLDYSHWHYVYDRMKLGQVYKNASPPALGPQIDLQTENQTLREQIAILERSAQVDKEAVQDVQKHFRELQDEISELREELEFYRGIVASTKHGSGLRIQGLQLSATGEAQQYHYKLVLTNMDKGDKVATGRVSLSVEGHLGGAPQTLDHASLAGTGADGLPFKFKHFQRLEGNIRVPEGFDPARVGVSIQEAGDKDAKESKTYEWSRIISK